MPVIRKHRDLRKATVDALTLSKIALHEVKKARAKLKALGQTSLDEYLTALELVLERVVLRLTTITATGIATRELIAPVLVLVKNATEYFTALPPGITSSLYELEAALTVMFEQAPGDETLESVFVDARYKAETEKILEEAREEARRKLGEQLSS
ncbi:MAG: hypothetical protein GSR72_06000 [Desulfurococcales archaeon]|nr:hypothetical protein [Desulfurococcales archaeon]MEB3789424.1 hypothetical protein [Desulfurococcales archaeon]